MATFSELAARLSKTALEKKGPFVDSERQKAIDRVSKARGGRNVLIYASAFLQKPNAPPSSLSISKEDIHGFMNALHGLDCSKGLSLILHTPGGDLNAIETIVAYLREKFDDLEVIVPTYAMSAGTMLALASDRVIMGRQSQLGPTDPQIAGRFSAGAIVAQFQVARSEILANPLAAHAWAPALQPLGPSLYQDSVNALKYAERMVTEWLAERMFSKLPDPASAAAKTAKHFGDTSIHLNHGRRIGRDEAKQHGVVVIELESDQELQDAVLTVYHLATITFELSPAVKLIAGRGQNYWMKNMVPGVA